MYDLTQWFLMPSVHAGKKTISGLPYGIETHHTEGTNVSGNNPPTKVFSYQKDTGKTMIFSKAPQKDSTGKLTQGWPWDMKQYDQNGIYDWVTELNWTSPRDYKAMDMTKFAMCPRYWDGDPTVYRASQTGPWAGFQNCNKTTSGDVGPIRYTLDGPFLYDVGGDVGVINTILLQYYWTDPRNREQLFLTDPNGQRPIGWAVWTHATFKAVTGSQMEYVIDSKSVHNMIVAGQVAPYFPCQVIP